MLINSLMHHPSQFTFHISISPLLMEQYSTKPASYTKSLKCK